MAGGPPGCEYGANGPLAGRPLAPAAGAPPANQVPLCGASMGGGMGGE